MKGGYLKG